MDSRVLKAIISSCDAITSDENITAHYQKLRDNKKFVPVSDIITNALCMSLTKLLCYKVSKEAYQRYSVRTEVINSIREWCQIRESLNSAHVLTNGTHFLIFTKHLLNKYLSDEVLNTCNDSDSMLSLTSALVYLVPQHAHFMCHVQRLIIRLSQLEPTSRSEHLLCYIAQKYISLGAQVSTIERIYILHRHKLVEEVLLNFFLSTNLDPTKVNERNNSNTMGSLDQLLQFSVNSSCVFQLIANFLKALLVHLKYAPAILAFIQLVLNRISECCENRGVNIIDLYPTNLHSCIILLMIEPNCHTSNSKDYTLHTLKELMVENQNSILVLLSHFPKWLEPFSVFYTEQQEIPTIRKD